MSTKCHSPLLCGGDHSGVPACAALRRGTNHGLGCTMSRKGTTSMWRAATNGALLATLVPLIAVLGGCASWRMVEPATPKHVALDGASKHEPATLACTQWLDALDAALAAHGKRDAGESRIHGFAYLRVNRFLASIGQTLIDEAATTSATTHAQRTLVWAQHLAALDQEARTAEIKNLTRAVVEPLFNDSGLRAQQALRVEPIKTSLTPTQAAQETTQLCRQHLLAIDMVNPTSRRTLLRAARVPDDYATWQRWAGLYAVTQLPFFAGVQRWQQGAQAQWAAVQAGQAQAPSHRLEPNVTSKRQTSIKIPLDRDALGIPVLSADAAQALLDRHAPVFEYTPTGAFDLPGAMHWPSVQAATPAVDTSRPTVYQRISHTRWGGRVRLQLVYTVWFSERPLDSAWDLLGGALDGVTWRITLGESLEPLMHDSIHPCGCYHLFIPTQGVVAKAAPQAIEEWAFMPRSPLPASTPNAAQPNRVVLTLASRTHHVVGVGDASTASSTASAPNVQTYQLLSDDLLRALPQPDGQHRSVYGEDGIIVGTARGERYVFWPMGIDSPGAMRQWGRHATAFVGRRHFDDADLLDRRFALPRGR